MTGDFFLTNWFLIAMKWLYSNLGSVFLTVLISTVVLRGLTIFSDIGTRKSSAKMAAIQPDIDRLKKKYGSDPKRMQAEQSKLMKEKGVSMWGSCLPLLITMPLFFCFIAAFRYWGYEMTIRLLVDDNAVELFQSFRFLWVHNIWQADNGTMPIIQAASTFLATQDMGKLSFLRDNPEIWKKLLDMRLVGQTAPALNKAGEWVQQYVFLTTNSAINSYDTAMQPLLDLYPGRNNGWFLLPVIAAGTNFLSSWMMQKNNPPAANQQGGNQGKLMMYMFPAMSFFFCLTSNAAFAIYWTLSSILMILINLVLNKAYPRVPVAAADNGRK